MKPQRERLNSSQQDREGRTPYDPTILTKLMVHQDHAKSRTREREIKHISPEGELLPPRHGDRRDDEDGLR